MQNKKVILLVGLPGAGKSHYVKNYIQAHSTDSVGVSSSDEYFQRGKKYSWSAAMLDDAHEYCFLKFRKLLKQGVETVFVDNTNLQRAHRTEYAKEAVRNGYKVFLKVFPVDVELSKARNVHDVSDNTLTNMANKIDIAPGEYQIVDGKEVSSVIESTKIQLIAKDIINGRLT